MRSTTDSGASGRVVVITSGAAFAIHHFRVEGVILAKIDEIGVGRGLGGELLEIRKHRLEPGRFDTAEKRERRFRRRAFGPIELNQTFERLERAPRRYRRDMPAENRPFFADAAADHHEVMRCGTSADFAQAALETDAGDVMLSAAVRAAAD